MKAEETHLQAESPQEIALYKARLNLLVDQTPAGVWSGIATAFLFLYLAWGTVNTSTLILWFCCFIAGATAHLLLTRYIKNKLGEREAGISLPKLIKFEQLMSLSFFIGGFIFGFIGVLMEPGWPLTLIITVPLMIAGAVGASLGSNQSSFLAYVSFITPLTFMSAISFFLIEMPLLGAFVLVFYIVMVVTGKVTHQLLIESFKLRINNSELIEDLTQNSKTKDELLGQLRKSEQLSSGAFDGSGVAMLLVDRETNIFKVNRAACTLFQISKANLIDTHLMVAPHTENYTKNIKLFKELVEDKRLQFQTVEKYTQGDGRADVWVEVTISAIRDVNENFEYAVVHIKDISKEYNLTEKLTYQAQHDSLTGLPNRYSFETKLQSLRELENIDKQVLCYIDLDQFKVVNDTCGHVAGDELLKQLALLLKQTLRKSDFLARIGGDEFVVLLFNCAMDDAVKQFEKVLTILREFRFIYEGKSFNVGASIGIVEINENSVAEDVLKQADSACYAAKDAGRDRLHVYRQDDEVLALRKGEMAWVSRIQHAIENDRFVLYHQKIVPIRGKKRIPHFELLIRMIDGDGSIISPETFLPAAERYNLAATIDLWVVKHMIDVLNAAIEERKDIKGIYGVNLSGQSLGNARFYEQIIQIISANDLRETGAIICFEVTETAAISNITAALRLMTELRELGCQFALDDFGSGLSSFAYLKQMPIDYLKIDGLFVKDCLADHVNLEIIASINGIGQVMGLETIAEYVENDEIFNKLAELDVDYAQGYWDGGPTPWIIY